jgi:hypothetical protein
MKGVFEFTWFCFLICIGISLMSDDFTRLSTHRSFVDIRFIDY